MLEVNVGWGVNALARLSADENALKFRLSRLDLATCVQFVVLELSFYVEKLRVSMHVVVDHGALVHVDRLYHMLLLFMALLHNLGIFLVVLLHIVFIEGGRRGVRALLRFF
jgi:hypothetical protein